ncbi:MAG: hypothetical protein ACREX8_01325 [Gammaproteobacteria bacterium]
MATTERIHTDDLNEIDGFAVRAGPHVVIAISNAVPRAERKSLAEELSIAVRSAPGRYATVVRHIRDADHDLSRERARSRWRPNGVAIAVVAALIVNLDLAG